MINRYRALAPLIDHLTSHNITPIFVGGCVRDHLLGNGSLDIDIELYGVESTDSLREYLKPFGKINEVGKSFGVFKFRYEGYAIDLSLPRTENKSAQGHKGFKVQTYSEIDFATASRRRDFTINSMGYNPQTYTLLDPYSGADDLSAKILRCVDPLTFVEDPLRVLRAMQFVARFDLTCDPQLLALCSQMVTKGALKELPKERIFEEFRKLLLLSQKPSLGLSLLALMGAKHLLAPPSDEAWNKTLLLVDETPKDLALRLCALLLETENPESVLQQLTAQRSLLSSTLTLIKYARKYGVISHLPQPILQGRDLIALGLTPGLAFKEILNSAYDAQLNQQFFTKPEADAWLKTYLVIAL
ncbi:MAG: hypothetical protein PHV62_00340 [Sulfuricurvum sp.]|nr:hypothetical protein [Sulfuricurvum sp.]